MRLSLKAFLPVLAVLWTLGSASDLQAQGRGAATMQAEQPSGYCLICVVEYYPEQGVAKCWDAMGTTGATACWANGYYCVMGGRECYRSWPVSSIDLAPDGVVLASDGTVRFETGRCASLTEVRPGTTVAASAGDRPTPEEISL